MPANSNSNQTDENGNLIRPKYLSNHTHYSPTDTDARVSVKPGKARQLNYFGQIAVDDAHMLSQERVLILLINATVNV